MSKSQAPAGILQNDKDQAAKPGFRAPSNKKSKATAKKKQRPKKRK
jgi:hypothetical protein